MRWENKSLAASGASWPMPMAPAPLSTTRHRMRSALPELEAEVDLLAAVKLNRCGGLTCGRLERGDSQSPVGHTAQSEAAVCICEREERVVQNSQVGLALPRLMHFALDAHQTFCLVEFQRSAAARAEYRHVQYPTAILLHHLHRMKLVIYRADHQRLAHLDRRQRGRKSRSEVFQSDRLISGFEYELVQAIGNKYQG